MGRVIVGQKHLLDRLLIALLTNGHVLLEGVPGLAKTLALKTLASCISVRFKRLQFTPDMLPADIVGTMIYNPQDGAFRTKQGPIFSNLILADEINRAPAKVQSALLEAMQERQVTIGDETYPLPTPFLVLATQNPLEQEGTYPLPEAQIDRFMMKVIVDYPTRIEERAILDAMATTEPMVVPRTVVSASQVVEARHVVNMLFVDDKVRDYIVDIVLATRPPIAAGLELERLCSNRRFASCDHRAHAGCTRHGVSQRPALRHSAGRQDGCDGCAAPPGVGDLRGRGRERHFRECHRENLEYAAGALSTEVFRWRTRRNRPRRCAAACVSWRSALAAWSMTAWRAPTTRCSRAGEWTSTRSANTARGTRFGPSTGT